MVITGLLNKSGCKNESSKEKAKRMWGTRWMQVANNVFPCTHILDNPRLVNMSGNEKSWNGVGAIKPHKNLEVDTRCIYCASIILRTASA